MEPHNIQAGQKASAARDAYVAARDITTITFSNAGAVIGVQAGSVAGDLIIGADPD